MVSFLLSEGHTQVWHYPIWMLWEHVEIARRRIQMRMVTAATSMAMAASLSNGGKKSGKLFKDYLEKLGGEE